MGKDLRYEGTFHGVPYTVDDDGLMILGEWSKSFDLIPSDDVDIDVMKNVRSIETEGRIFLKGDCSNLFSCFDSCKSMSLGCDTLNVESMKGMFEGCKSLEVLGISSFDTQNVKRLDYMFRDCSSLRELNIYPFDSGTRFVIDRLNDCVIDNDRMVGMFENCGIKFDFSASLAADKEGLLSEYEEFDTARRYMEKDGKTYMYGEGREYGLNSCIKRVRDLDERCEKKYGSSCRDLLWGKPQKIGLSNEKAKLDEGLKDIQNKVDELGLNTESETETEDVWE